MSQQQEMPYALAQYIRDGSDFFEVGPMPNTQASEHPFENRTMPQRQMHYPNAHCISDCTSDYFNVGPAPVAANPATATFAMATGAPAPAWGAKGCLAFPPPGGLGFVAFPPPGLGFQDFPPPVLDSSTYRVPVKAEVCYCTVCTRPIGYNYYQDVPSPEPSLRNLPSLRSSKDFGANQAEGTQSESNTWDNLSSTSTGNLSSRTGFSIGYHEARAFNRGRKGSLSKSFGGSPYTTRPPSVSQSYFADESNDEFDIAPSDSELSFTDNSEKAEAMDRVQEASRKLQRALWGDTSGEQDAIYETQHWQQTAKDPAEEARVLNHNQEATHQLQRALWGCTLEERNAAQEPQLRQQAAQYSDGKNSGVLPSSFDQKVAASTQANGTGQSRNEPAEDTHSSSGSFSNSDGGVASTEGSTPTSAARRPSYVKVAVYLRDTTGEYTAKTRDILDHTMHEWMLDRFALLQRRPVVPGRGLEVRVRVDTVDQNGMVRNELISHEFADQSMAILEQGLMGAERPEQSDDSLHGDRYAEETRPLVIEIVYEGEEYSATHVERGDERVRANYVPTLTIGSPESALGQANPSISELLDQESEFGYEIEESRFAHSLANFVLDSPPSTPMPPNTYISDLLADAGYEYDGADQRW